MSKKEQTPAETLYLTLGGRNRGHRRDKLVPGDEEKIVGLIEQAMKEGQPVQFVMLWGQGEREHIVAPEAIAVQFLSKSLEGLAQGVEAGAIVNVVFSDSHISFNGFHVSAQYRDEVSKLFEKTFEGKNLSHTMQNMSSIVSYTPTEDGKSFKEHARFLAEAPTVEIEPSLLRELTVSAERHFGADPTVTPETAAKAYYLMNRYETPTLAAKFKGNIYLTYNSGKHAFVVPEGLPAFNMYSLKKGISEKPWFADERILAPATLREAPEIVGTEPVQKPERGK